LLSLPRLIAVANALRVRNCSFAAGFGFFVLLPLATVVYAAPAGVLARVAVAPPRRGGALARAIPGGALVWGAAPRRRVPGGVGGLGAASSLSGPARVRVRSVRRLFPRADLR